MAPLDTAKGPEKSKDVEDALKAMRAQMEKTETMDNVVSAGRARVGKSTLWTPGKQKERQEGKKLTEEWGSKEEIEKRRAETNALYKKSVLKRTTRKDGEKEVVEEEYKSPLTLTRIYEDRADARKLKVYQLAEQLKGKEKDAGSQKIVWQMMKLQDQISVEESKSAFVSAYQDMMELYQQLKSGRFSLPAEYNKDEANAIQHYALFRLYSEGRVRTSVEIDGIYMRIDALNAKIKKTGKADDRRDLFKEMADLQALLQAAFRKGEKYENDIQNLLCCKEGVPGANKDGLLPVEKIIRVMLQEDQKEILGEYRTIAKASEDALDKMGSTVRDKKSEAIYKSRETKFTALETRGKKNAQYVSDCTMHQGRFRLHLLKITTLRNRSFTGINVGEGLRPIDADKGEKPEDFAGSSEWLDREARASIDKLKDQMKVLRESILPVNDPKKGNETAFIDDMAYRLSLLHESFSPRSTQVGNAANAGGDAVFGKLNPWGKARRQYEASALFDAVGWPRDPKTGDPKKWEDLSEAEQKNINDKKKTMKDVVAEATKEPKVFDRYEDSLDVVDEMAKDEFWKGNTQLDLSSLDEKKLPPKGTRITVKNARDLVEKQGYDKQVIVVLACQQLQEDFEAFGERYCKLIHDMHQIIGVNFRVEVAEADMRMRRQETDKLIDRLAQFAVVGFLLRGQIYKMLIKPVGSGIAKTWSAGVRLVRPPPVTKVGNGAPLSGVKNALRNFNTSSETFKNLAAAEKQLKELQELAAAAKGTANEAKALAAFKAAELTRNIKLAEYLEGVLGKAAGTFVQGGKLTEQGAKVVEVLSKTGQTTRQMVAALKALKLSNSEIQLALRSGGATGDVMSASAKMFIELAQASKVALKLAIKSGQLTRAQVAIILKLAETGKLTAEGLKALQAAAQEGRLTAENAKILAEGAKLSRFGQILKVVGKSAIVVAGIIDLYLMFEGIIRFADWQKEHEEARKDIEYQLVKVMKFEKISKNEYKHKESGITVNCSSMLDYMDRQLWEPGMDAGLAALGVLAAGYALAGGPFGALILIGVLIIQFTVGKVVEGWSEKNRIRFLYECRKCPWLLAGIGTYSTIHKSGAGELDYLSDWRLGEQMHSFFMGGGLLAPLLSDQGEIDAMKPTVRELLLYMLYCQELQFYLPELYQKSFDSPNMVKEMDDFYKGRFKTMILPGFYKKLRNILDDEGDRKGNKIDDVSELSDKELFGKASPMQIRKAMRQGEGIKLYFQAKDEERYLAVLEEHEKDPDFVAQRGKAMVARADLLDQLGKKRAFGKAFKDLTPSEIKELREFLKAKGYKTRADWVATKLPEDDGPDLGSAELDMPGYKGTYEFGKGFKSDDPITQHRLDHIFEAEPGNEKYIAAADAYKYAVKSVFWKLNHVSPRQWGWVSWSNRTLGANASSREGVGSVARKLTANVSEYFSMSHIEVVPSAKWAEDLYGGTDKEKAARKKRDGDNRDLPIVFVSNMKLRWYKTEDPQSVQEQREKDRMVHWCKSLSDDVRNAEQFKGMKLISASFRQDAYSENKMIRHEDSWDKAHNYVAAMGKPYDEENIVIQGDFILEDPVTGKRYALRHSAFGFRNTDAQQIGKPNGDIVKSTQLTGKSYRWKWFKGGLLPMHLSDLLSDRTGRDLLQKVDELEAGKITRDALALSNRVNKKEGKTPPKYVRGDREKKLETSVNAGNPLKPLLYIAAPASLKFAKPGDPEMQLCRELAAVPYGNGATSRNIAAVFIEFHHEEGWNGDDRITAVATYVEDPEYDRSAKDYNVFIHQRGGVAKHYEKGGWQIALGAKYSTMHEHNVSDRARWLSDSLSIKVRFGDEEKVAKTLAAHAYERNSAIMQSAKECIQLLRGIDVATLPPNRFTHVGRGEHYGVIEGDETLFQSREIMGLAKRYKLCLYSAKYQRYFPLPFDFEQVPSEKDLEKKYKTSIDVERKKLIKKYDPDGKKGLELEVTFWQRNMIGEFDSIVTASEEGANLNVPVWSAKELVSRVNIPQNVRERIIRLYCAPLETPEATLDRMLSLFEGEVSASNVSAKAALRKNLLPLLNAASDKQLFLLGVFNECLAAGWISAKVAEDLAKKPSLKERASTLRVCVDEPRTIELPRGYALALSSWNSSGVYLRLSEANEEKGSIVIERMKDGKPTGVLAPQKGNSGGASGVYRTEDLKGELRITLKDAEDRVLTQASFQIAKDKIFGTFEDKVRADKGKLHSASAGEHHIVFAASDRIGVSRAILRAGGVPRKPQEIFGVKDHYSIAFHGEQLHLRLSYGGGATDEVYFTSAAHLHAYFCTEDSRDIIEAEMEGDKRASMLAKLDEIDTALKTRYVPESLDIIREQWLLLKAQVQTDMKDGDEKDKLLALLQQMSSEIGILVRRKEVLAVLTSPSANQKPNSTEYYEPLYRIVRLFQTGSMENNQHELFLYHLCEMYGQDTISKSAAKQREFLLAVYQALDEEAEKKKKPPKVSEDAFTLHRYSVVDRLTLAAAETAIEKKFPKEHSYYLLRCLRFSDSNPVAQVQYMHIRTTLPTAKKTTTEPMEEEEEKDDKGYYARFCPEQKYFVMRKLRAGEAAAEVVDPPPPGEGGKRIVPPVGPYRFALVSPAERTAPPQWHKVETIQDVFADRVERRFQKAALDKELAAERDRYHRLPDDSPERFVSLSTRLGLVSATFKPPVFPAEQKLVSTMAYQALSTPAPAGSSEDEHAKSLLDILDLCSYEATFTDGELIRQEETSVKRDLLRDLKALYNGPGVHDRKAFLVGLLEELKKLPDSAYLTPRNADAVLTGMRRYVRHEQAAPLVSVKEGSTIVPFADGTYLECRTTAGGQQMLVMVKEPNPKGEAMVCADGNYIIEISPSRATNESERNNEKYEQTTRKLLNARDFSRIDLTITVKTKRGTVLLDKMPLRFGGTEEKREAAVIERQKAALGKELEAVKTLAKAPRPDLVTIRKKSAEFQELLADTYSVIEDRDAFMKKAFPSSFHYGDSGSLRYYPQVGLFELAEQKEAVDELSYKIGALWDRITVGREPLGVLKKLVADELNPLLAELKLATGARPADVRRRIARYVQDGATLTPIEGYARTRLRVDGKTFKAELAAAKTDSPEQLSLEVNVREQMKALLAGMKSGAAVPALEKQAEAINTLLDEMPARERDTYLLAEQFPELQSVPRVAKNEKIGLVVKDGRLRVSDVAADGADALASYKDALSQIAELVKQSDAGKKTFLSSVEPLVVGLNARIEELRMNFGWSYKLPSVPDGPQWIETYDKQLLGVQFGAAQKRFEIWQEDRCIFPAEPVAATPPATVNAARAKDPLL